MNFLDRNTLPKFQERLDLAASELNDMEEIICKAINELAGRMYILTNLIPLEEREQYAQENSFLILDTIASIQGGLKNLEDKVTEIENKRTTDVEDLNNKFTDLEARLNALDDAAARKADLNVVLYRTGELE
jgi:hypothetical protein